MTDQEFMKLKNRYYSWKAMQPQGSRLDIEQAALKWGYVSAMKDAAARVGELLFGEVGP